MNTENALVTPTAKQLWTRRNRNEFKATFGYSITAHYGAGGKRQDVLKRDGFKCVRCGMTDADHKLKWGRPITIDHKDRNRKNNELLNLQTLCLSCHGRKDILPHLIAPRCISQKSLIMSLRQEGQTYQAIANATGFTIAAIWKNIRKWRIQ